MTDSLSIASVTATFQFLVESAIHASPNTVANATVTTLVPGSTGLPSAGVNVFLYHLAPNASLRNFDAPTRTSRGQLRQRPCVGLDLFYLLSFYGEANRFEPERLMGIVVQALHSRPFAGPEAIDAALTATLARVDDDFTFMTDSVLARQGEFLRWTPEMLNLEELSKLWSVFFQTAYVPSLAYRVGPVYVEADESTAPARPTQRVIARVLPAAAPQLQRVMSTSGPQAAIVSGSMLTLEGRQLAGEDVVVRMGDVEVAIPPADASYDAIRVTVPAALPAGVRTVRVSHRVMLGDPAIPHQGLESNVIAFVLRPAITNVALADPASESDGDGGFVHSGRVTFDITPAVEPRQKLTLILSNSSGSSAFFPLTPAAASSSLSVDVSGMQAGVWAVDIRVDGAESVVTGGAPHPTVEFS